MRRLLIVGLFVIPLMGTSSAWAQKANHLSIATGGTGGLYYPIGNGMASLVSKYIPNVGAKAEVTGGSVDNLLLINEKKADLAFAIADVAWEIYQGKGKRFKERVPLKTIAVVYPVFIHLVTLESKGVDAVTDLKGKRIATGAPGSWTDTTSRRVLEAFQLNPEKDLTRIQLGPSDSSVALKDNKIDAFFWGGGLPTGSLSELAMSPGMKMRLIPNADAVPPMREKYGPIYVKGIIPAKTYFLQETDAAVSVVWNLLVCHESMREDLAYQITRTLIEHQPELAAVQREARFLTLEAQAGGGSPVPYHPGALRYFTERGMRVGK